MTQPTSPASCRRRERARDTDGKRAGREEQHRVGRDRRRGFVHGLLDRRRDVFGHGRVAEIVEHIVMRRRHDVDGAGLRREEDARRAMSARSSPRLITNVTADRVGPAATAEGGGDRHTITASADRDRGRPQRGEHAARRVDHVRVTRRRDRQAERDRARGGAQKTRRRARCLIAPASSRVLLIRLGHPGRAGRLEKVSAAPPARHRIPRMSSGVD